MRYLLTICFSLVTLFACRSHTSEKVNKTIAKTQTCQPGNDTINIIITFTRDPTTTPTERFYSVVNFINGKGLFKPQLNKTNELKIESETDKIYHVVYDSCNMQRSVTKNYIMKNIHASKIGFSSTKKDKFTGLRPGFNLEEWKFANNMDRDSAMRIVQKVYRNPNNIVIYEKRYSQFIMDDERIFLLEAGAKFAEPYAIQYKKLVENFIGKTNNTH